MIISGGLRPECTIFAEAEPGVGILSKNLTRCQAEFLTSRHVRMHRVIFYISNTLRKLIVRAQGLVFR